VGGDTLYFYVSGRAGQEGSSRSGVCSTGLATLRRDGFASLRAGDRPGRLTTRPVVFQGRHLFVNAHAGNGELRVEVLNEKGEDCATCKPGARDMFWVATFALPSNVELDKLRIVNMQDLADVEAQ
jgi:hypothetical protein